MKDKFLLALLVGLVGVPAIALLGLIALSHYVIVAFAFQHGFWWGVASIVGLVWFNLAIVVTSLMEGR